jgi:outer membrane protein OmpA-like peptidoglycan-associated protein
VALIDSKGADVLLSSWRALCAVITLGLGLSLTACGTVPDQSQAATVIVVATATANEPGATLPLGFDQVLKAANDSHQGKLTVVTPRAGRAESVGDPVQVRVLRDGTEDENDPQLVAEGLQNISSEVATRVTSLASNEPVLDLLTGLAEAARRAPKSTIVAISSGLQTTGLIDFTGLGWEFTDSAVVDNLRATGFLPDLTGKTVFFVGLGETAGTAQAALPEPMRKQVESLWLDICRAGGAQQCSESQPTSITPTRSTSPAKVVDVPVFTLPPLPDRGVIDVPVPTEALFAPDSADLLPQADGQLGGLASELRDHGATIDLVGHTWSVGSADSARDLSRQRAQAVAAALIRHGLPPQCIGSTAGVGYDQPIKPPGADELQTAAANRVVVITVHTGT